jgi:hypothetical protein
VIDVLVTAMHDELLKIAMDEEARKRLIAGLHAGGAAALGVGLGSAAANTLAYGLQRGGVVDVSKVPQWLADMKYPSLIAIPAGLTLGGASLYAEHKLREAQRRYVEEAAKQDAGTDAHH